MQSDRSSKTAQLAALARASLARDAPPFQGTDTLAHRFLTPRYRLMLTMRFLVRPILQRRMPGTYPFLLARSRFFERCLLEEVNDGATQVVILGAGLDTRAYRLNLPDAVRVFEVDSPGTSRLKQARVDAVLGAKPAHVVYVAVDFNRDALGERLFDAGYQSNRRTFFLWEGVTFYLEESAVDAVLRFVGEHTAPASAIAFDHLYDDVPGGASDRFGAREGAAYVKRQGEPFRWGLPDGGEARFLAARGLRCEQLLTPSDMDELLRAPDGRAGDKVARMYGIVLARRD